MIAARCMPRRSDIARYWDEQETFPEVVFSDPGCFACGYCPRGINARSSLKVRWDYSRLERAHLIAKAEGIPGGNGVHNVVLLCARCHRCAPMVGISPEPMIDWINRREGFPDYLVRRISEEFNGTVAGLADISRQLSEAGIEPETLRGEFRAMIKFLKIGVHPGGEPYASIAAVLRCMIEFHRAKSSS